MDLTTGSQGTSGGHSHPLLIHLEYKHQGSTHRDRKQWTLQQVLQELLVAIPASFLIHLEYKHQGSTHRDRKQWTLQQVLKELLVAIPASFLIHLEYKHQGSTHRDRKQWTLHSQGQETMDLTTGSQGTSGGHSRLLPDTPGI